MPSTTPPQSHCPSQSLCCPATHCPVIAHCNHTAAIHCDCHCRPSHVPSHCAASALAAIVRRHLCRPSRCRHPIANCNCFSVPPPIALCYVISTLVLILQILTCFLLVLHKKAYCMKVQYFVKYRNTCFRDPTTLLSMDIMVERFLEIGASDLLVSTQWLQDPLYTKV